MPKYNKEVVEINGAVCAETHAAYKFICDGWDEDEAVWLPKSQVVWNPMSEDAVEGTMDMPTWLAEQHKLG